MGITSPSNWISRHSPLPRRPASAAQKPSFPKKVKKELQKALDIWYQKGYNLVARKLQAFFMCQEFRGRPSPPAALSSRFLGVQPKRGSKSCNKNHPLSLQQVVFVLRIFRWRGAAVRGRRRSGGLSAAGRMSDMGQRPAGGTGRPCAVPAPRRLTPSRAVGRSGWRAAPPGPARCPR